MTSFSQSIPALQDKYHFDLSCPSKICLEMWEKRQTSSLIQLMKNIAEDDSPLAEAISRCYQQVTTGKDASRKDCEAIAQRLRARSESVFGDLSPRRQEMLLRYLLEELDTRALTHEFLKAKPRPEAVSLYSTPLLSDDRTLPPPLQILGNIARAMKVSLPTLSPLDHAIANRGRSLPLAMLWKHLNTGRQSRHSLEVLTWELHDAMEVCRTQRRSSLLKLFAKEVCQWAASNKAPKAMLKNPLSYLETLCGRINQSIYRGLEGNQALEGFLDKKLAAECRMVRTALEGVLRDDGKKEWLNKLKRPCFHKASYGLLAQLRRLASLEQAPAVARYLDDWGRTADTDLNVIAIGRGNQRGLQVPVMVWETLGLDPWVRTRVDVFEELAPGQIPQFLLDQRGWWDRCGKREVYRHREYPMLRVYVHRFRFPQEADSPLAIALKKELYLGITRKLLQGRMVQVSAPHRDDKLPCLFKELGNRLALSSLGNPTGYHVHRYRTKAV